MNNTTTTEQEELQIEQEFRALLADYATTRRHQREEIIIRAYHFAKQAHAGVRRRSGEPYIMHPIAVARIVAREIGLGSTSICAALLHDVVEDTDTTVEDIQALFGEKIAHIVDGLTKISGGIFGQQASQQAENFRKLIFTMSSDVRVVLVKIADRLHNMRTLEFQPQEKQLKIAGETQYIYAPLAYRLGLFPIKQELENLSFKYEHPEQYADICRRLNENSNARLEAFERFAAPIRQKLTDMGYEFELKARIKTPYSVFKKMQDKNVSFEDVYDLIAARIVFTPNTDRSEREQCWGIYSAITEIYRPHPERIRDWISTPKSNGYEALHVTVMAQDGQWIEVQIRTVRMHEIAEKGLAAHWKYKMGIDDSTGLDQWIHQIRELLKDPNPNAIDLLDNFKLNLFASEIFVFTPQGEMMTLPLGATVLDFAYQLHTKLGEQCIGAKVNHTLQPIDYKLQSGDQIEVIRSESQRPQRDWLNQVVTSKAKSRLGNYFRREERDLTKLGEQLFDKELQRLGKSEIRDMAIYRLSTYYGFRHPNHMFMQIGKGVVSLKPLESLLVPSKKRWWQLFSNPLHKQPQQPQQQMLPLGDEVNDTKPISATQRPNQNLKHIVLSDFNRDVEYQLAPCCHPIPGDEVFAYRDEQGIYIVHKATCKNAERIKSNYGKRLCTAEWRMHHTLTFAETIEMQGIDSKGLLVRIFEIISNHFNCNLHEVKITARNGLFAGTFELEVYDTEEIQLICNELGKIEEINSVKRLSSSTNKSF